MSTSSVVLDHSLDSQASPTATPQLQRESDRLRLLLDMTNTLVSNLGCHDLLRIISASIREKMHCDVVRVMLPDSEQRQLRSQAWDFPDTKGFSKENWFQPVEGSMVGEVFKTGTPLVIQTRADVMDIVKTPEILAEDIESVCVLPMISRNR